MSTFKGSIAAVVFVCSSALVTACGGGGGGGGSTGPSTLTYAGVTTQAVVDASNAQPLAATTLQAGGAGAAATPTGAVLVGDVAGSGEPRFVALADTLKGSLGRIDFASTGASVTGAVQSYSDTIPSPYGSGSFSFSFTFDDITGIFSGTATYNNYCENADSCVAGDAGFSGQLDTATYQLTSAQFTLTRLSVTENGNACQMSGSISMTMSSLTQSQVTMSFVLADGTGTYRVDNLVFNITDYGTYAEISIPSGRFYHPTYGYVDVWTPMALLYHVTSGVVAAWPYQGSLEIDGAGNTKALLTALSDDPNVTPQWRLQVDADGNGAWDIPETSGNWASL